MPRQLPDGEDENQADGTQMVSPVDLMDMILGIPLYSNSGKITTFSGEGKPYQLLKFHRDKYQLNYST